jgi:Zn-dependent membrane protease YugP
MEEGTGIVNVMSNLAIQWWITIIVGVVGMVVQARLRSVFAKYSKVRMAGGLTGREIAEKMLRDNGITDVQVVSTRGMLTDNYNPAKKTINLSEGVYNSNSVSAAAVAAHETGHAVQHATAYGPLRMRSALVPFISISSQWATLVIILGLVMIQAMPAIFWAGIGLIALSALFSIVTLPVEFNASARAMRWLRDSRTLETEQLTQARSALSWAASTYLIAALSAITVLLYYLAIARRD